MKEYFDYEDIRLIPKKGIVNSRTECDTSIKLGKFTFDLPVYPANMKSVVDEETCVYLAQRNIFYTYHRFHENYIKDQIDFIVKMKEKNLFTSISIGVKDEDYRLIDQLLFNNLIPDFIIVDIAHGHSEILKRMLKYLKNEKISSFIIAGNICTTEAVQDLIEWGADCLKINLSNGAACSTYHKTGFGSNSWSLSCVKKCAEISSVPIISDGGIKNHGDIVKTLVMGATACMAGFLFTGYDQSAGNIIEIEENNFYKEYYGSASKYNKKEEKNIEGKKMLIKYRGNMDRLLVELKEDLQSAISYSGGKEIKDLKNTDYIIL